VAAGDDADFEGLRGRPAAAVEASSSSSTTSLLNSSDERSSSMLFDEDVRSDNIDAPFLSRLLFEMSSYTRINSKGQIPFAILVADRSEAGRRPAAS